jgi:hypothetical protein
MTILRLVVCTTTSVETEWVGMKQVVLALLRAYKWLLSPLLPPSCRYVPTCSEYAREAVERYGAVRGGCMAAWRVLRCHPFVKGGYDPVVRQTFGDDGSLERGRSA